MRHALLFGIALTLAGCDQHPQSAAQCFRVAYANTGTVPATAIRWNKCTGETWLLLESDHFDSDGKRDGGEWHWHPIPVSTEAASRAGI
jgi:hypothetical protein